MCEYDDYDDYDDYDEHDEPEPEYAEDGYPIDPQLKEYYDTIEREWEPEWGDPEEETTVPPKWSGGRAPADSGLYTATHSRQAPRPIEA